MAVVSDPAMTGVQSQHWVISNGVECSIPRVLAVGSSSGITIPEGVLSSFCV